MSGLKQYLESLVEQAKLLPQEKIIQFLKVELNKVTDPERRQIVESYLAVSLANIKPIRHLVVLIHGIRTHAEWQSAVRDELERAGVSKVYKIGYEFFDVIRFWIPYLFRKGPIRRVLRELRGIRSENQDAYISILAHSYGTYIISQILKTEGDIKIHRLLLCGSIVPASYNWEIIPNKPKAPIVNDVGTRDIYPILAEGTTIGYGASGRFGFQTHRVEDRFHDLTHSGFFDADIVRKYWVPFFASGEIVQNSLPPPKAPYWALPLQKLKYVLAFIGIIIYWEWEPIKEMLGALWSTVRAIL